MADEGIDIDLENLEKRMDGALSSLRNEFLSLRTGRASASMLDPINMDSYGSLVPLSQCGTINVPDPRMITVNIWDKSLVSAAEKAIRDSGLGINPVIDGTIIRLPIPELNEERRRELTKLAATYAENARIAVRNVRRDGMDQIKKAVMDGLLKPDDPLPSIRQLANDLELNHNTVAKAYRILERDSVIQTKGYRGTSIHGDAKQNSTVDMNDSITTKLSETIKSLRESGATDSEIRITFSDVMKKN